jgi:hypothetical protein
MPNREGGGPENMDRSLDTVAVVDVGLNAASRVYHL